MLCKVQSADDLVLLLEQYRIGYLITDLEVLVVKDDKLVGKASKVEFECRENKTQKVTLVVHLKEGA